MRFYIISTRTNQKDGEYFLTYTVRNKRKFFRRAYNGDYPFVLYRDDIKCGMETINKIKSYLLPIQTATDNTINFGYNILESRESSRYGFWVKIDLNALLSIINFYIRMDNENCIDNMLSKKFDNLVVGQKRKIDRTDEDLAKSFGTLLVKQKKYCYDEDPYLADIEEMN